MGHNLIQAWGLYTIRLVTQAEYKNTCQNSVFLGISQRWSLRTSWPGGESNSGHSERYNKNRHKVGDICIYRCIMNRVQQQQIKTSKIVMSLSEAMAWR